MGRAQTVTEAQAWVMAARPKTLPAAMAPVFVGIALAYRDRAFSLLPALAAMVGALLIQIGVNLANDYFDYVKGVDTVDRAGPTRVTQSGLIPPERVKRGMIFTFFAAMAVGVYLVAVAGWPILVIGVASIMSAVGYAGGPHPLGSHGLGDLFVFIFFGLIAVTGTYYVQALAVTPQVFIAAVPMGGLATAILVVNNLRDIDTDRQSGKRTLAVMIGPRATRLEYVVLLVVAYMSPVWLWLVGHGSVWTLLPWVSLPLALQLVRMIYGGGAGPALNDVLAKTARLELIFSLLFAMGLVM
ncbi:MAG: 1,4-dihydroxy-2-naphthoate polyprenyltransferase [Anaerolineae bacterium]